jgi:hypothetical protein
MAASTWTPLRRRTATALAPGAVVSDIARRHGPRPQQVFTLRPQARQVPVAKLTSRSLYGGGGRTGSGYRPGDKALRCKAKPDLGGIDRLRSMESPSGPVAAQHMARALNCCLPRS